MYEREVRIPVRLRTLVLAGDCKTQQVVGGSNTGSSKYRCFCCFKGADEWNDSENSFNFTLPERSIAYGFLVYRDSLRKDWKGKVDKEKQKMTRLSSLLQGVDDDDIQRTENFISNHYLWSVWVGIDPLHVVEGHSLVLMTGLVSCYSSNTLLFGKLEKLLQEHCDVGFKATKHPGWKWREIWGSFPVTWEKVFSKEEHGSTRKLIYSWTKCCQLMYEDTHKRTQQRWLKFFGWSLVHFTIVREQQWLQANSLYD
jgi:hypothetical protein